MTQLSALLVYPFVMSSQGRGMLFNALGIVIVALVLRTVHATPALSWVAALLGAPAIVLLLLEAATDSNGLRASSSALAAGLYFYAAGALILHLVADREVTRDDLFALGATFTLVAWAFAYTYVVCQTVFPGSFAAAEDPGARRTWIELLYLSFSALTGTGLGDIAPVTPFARGLVMLEQLAGLGYVAILVSRLVGLTYRSPSPR